MRLSSLRRVTKKRWVLLAEVIVLLGAAKLSLFVVPFRRLTQLLRRFGNRPSMQRPRRWLNSGPARRDVIWAVNAAGDRLLGEKPCLPKALVGHYLLFRGGLETEIVFGVAKNGTDLRAHAWVEREGYVLVGGGRSLVEYAPLSKRLVLFKRGETPPVGEIPLAVTESEWT